MQIWHDDLGCEEDKHEMLVELRFSCGTGSAMAKVSRGDVAVAAMDEFDWNMYAEFFYTIRLLLLAGF